jgi:8-oxo-dGTP diphosphatase
MVAEKHKTEQPIAAVDTVIFTVKENALHVLLIKREREPFIGQWALAGGYIDTRYDTDIEATAKRKLLEKTGVATPYLEQVGTVGNATRDPRGWAMTTFYFALISSDDIALAPNDGASDSAWLKVTDGTVDEPLGFDHAEILLAAYNRLKSKVLYTTLPAHLLPTEFTIGELQHIYEIVLGTKLDRKSFQRRMFAANILEETGEMRASTRRPAKLYRLIEKNHEHYFLRNIEGAS